MRIVLFVVLASAIAALGVGGGAIEAVAAGSTTGATKVKLTLVEFKLTPAVKRVAAGKVTFSARNAGKLTHELVVLRTKVLAGKLPTSGMAAKETGRVGKIAKIGPGSTKTLTLTLKPGHYALICNLPGHYRAGQFADLTVG